jgi:hypothetical protein
VLRWTEWTRRHRGRSGRGLGASEWSEELTCAEEKNLAGAAFKVDSVRPSPGEAT